MSIGKLIIGSIVGILAIGVIFIVAQNANLSPPRSLGYQSAAVAGFEFDAGRFSANSYITIELQDGTQAKVAVDSGFSAPQIGQVVCIHSATKWFVNTPTHRFAQIRKCAG